MRDVLILSRLVALANARRVVTKALRLLDVARAVADVALLGAEGRWRLGGES